MYYNILKSFSNDGLCCQCDGLSKTIITDMAILEIGKPQINITYLDSFIMKRICPCVLSIASFLKKRTWGEKFPHSRKKKIVVFKQLKSD